MNTWKGKYGPLLIAEIGGNHEGDFDYAKRLTQLAIESGADFVKFQIYTGDTLVSALESPTRNQHFKKFELSPEQHIELAQLCQAHEVGYMASVWEEAALKWIDPYISIYKVGSGDLTAYPVLKTLAAYRKPLILSTGLATEAEVVEAVQFIRSQDPIYEKPEYLAVLQCTSMYPIPKDDANLRVMDQLRSLTGCPIGYSDHTEGSKALEIATAMGAEILEFHFTDSREGKTFRDHKVSLTRDEVIALRSKLQDIERLQGDRVKQPLAVEGDHVVSFRRAVYPVKDLPAGTTLSMNNLTTLRPNHGIDARDIFKVLGKKTTVDLKRHQKLDWEFLID